MWCWKRMKKIKWTGKVRNDLLERMGDKRTFLNNMLRRRPSWVGHILRRIFFLHDVIEGQMTEVKGVGRIIRTELLNDLRNRRIYRELKGGS